MDKQIQMAVTFIQQTREEAITLANNIVGDAEVHALVVQKGFAVNPEPVGYMVVQKPQWVGLSINEARDFYESELNKEELIHEIDKFLEEKNA